MAVYHQVQQGRRVTEEELLRQEMVALTEFSTEFHKFLKAFQISTKYFFYVFIEIYTIFFLKNYNKIKEAHWL